MLDIHPSRRFALAAAFIVSLAFLSLGASTSNASIVYNIDRTIGSGTVTGFIETDETIGVLGAANIIDWAFTLSAPNLQNGPTVLIAASNAGATIFEAGDSLVASVTELSFNFLPNQSSRFTFFENSSSYNLNSCFSLSVNECIQRDATTPNTDAQGVLNSGPVVIGTTAVPVPAAMWLFGSALMGLVGIKRKK